MISVLPLCELLAAHALEKEPKRQQSQNMQEVSMIHKRMNCLRYLQQLIHPGKGLNSRVALFFICAPVSLCSWDLFPWEVHGFVLLLSDLLIDPARIRLHYYAHPEISRVISKQTYHMIFFGEGQFDCLP